VIGPTGGVRVLVATTPVDFRKGAEGLAALVRETMKAEPFSGAVYVFRAKRADRVKLIYWDGTGVCLFAKRLEDGKFRWPNLHDLAFGHAGGRQPQQVADLAQGNLGPGMPSSLWKGAKPCRFADHPTAPVTPVHKWSRSPGIGGRDQSERLVVINRSKWSRSPGARTFAQDHCQLAAGAFVDMDGQKTALVVVRVEQRELLLARIERIVDVEDDRSRRPRPAGAE
jgi:transposase